MSLDQYPAANVRIARMVVRRATRFATYPTSEGQPREPYRTALEEAVEAQCAAWQGAGLEDQVTSGGATAAPALTSTSNQGASLSFDTSSADGAKAYLLGGGLAPEAEAILDEAGLLGGLPGVWR